MMNDKPVPKKRKTPKEVRQIKVLMHALAEELRLKLIDRSEYRRRARELWE